MPINLTVTPIAREAPSDTISSNTTSTSTRSKSEAEHGPVKTKQRLSERLPPLVFGTATLNYQFNVDPYALHPNTLVSSALASGVRAFDTSPYYGPAEEILGTALDSSEVKCHPSLQALRREDYHILTKAGRISSDEFDYSPSWIRHSVKRSLRRLRTTYLDVVYLHDVEFVSPAEVLSAIKTLREIRDTTGSLHYVGICGYPVHILTSLAEMISLETGEPLDIVQSYGNFTIQNQQLQSQGLQRLINAGVDVVANASPLGMGLLRSQGVPIGAMGNWHPAPDALRNACLNAAYTTQHEFDERLETVAVRYAMENWLAVASEVGAKGPVPIETITPTTNSEVSNARDVQNLNERPRLGVNVMGVSRLSELTDTMSVYNSIISGTSHPSTLSNTLQTTQTSQLRSEQIRQIATHLRGTALKEWREYAWSSPDPGFTNQRQVFGVSSAEEEELVKYKTLEAGVKTGNVDVEVDEKALVEAVKHLNVLERSVSAPGVGVDEKISGIEVVEERTGELTPPPA